MRHERNQNLLSGTQKEPAVNHYGGKYDRNSVFGAVHQDNDKGARNDTGSGKKGTD